jgi:hypothetical protein
MVALSGETCRGSGQCVRLCIQADMIVRYRCRVVVCAFDLRFRRHVKQQGIFSRIRRYGYHHDFVNIDTDPAQIADHVLRVTVPAQGFFIDHIKRRTNMFLALGS